MKRMVIENTKYLTLVHGSKGHDPPIYNNYMKHMYFEISYTYYLILVSESKRHDQLIYSNDMKPMALKIPNT